VGEKLPYKPKTAPTKVNPERFVRSVENDVRRADAEVLLRLFAKVSGWKPYMLGPTIVGFGHYHYTYASGQTGSACVVGFSPRKTSQVIYVFEFQEKARLLEKLGKHKGGIQQCLYINKLADIDIKILEKILQGGIAEAKKTWPVTPS
jgi:hypothetical protein